METFTNMAKFFRMFIGWGVAIVAVLVANIFPQPYAGWAGLFNLSWVAGWYSYYQFIESKNPLGEQIKEAIVACVMLGILAGLYYGYTTTNWDLFGSGDLVKIFPTTFDSKAGRGARVFLALIAGSSVGIYLADLTRKRRIRRIPKDSNPLSGNT